ncbi:hypothetical protein [Microbulbifer sp. SAOS-129_SWC]|uniref:hypothetical protein n=1 Tax=Microbulbifer sp. SAOS-129_SWC TaxID=3145235 RepID=UPI003216AE45
MLQTDLLEARLISELSGYAILSGRSCIDCDENPSIYIRKIPPASPAHAEGDGSDDRQGENERYTYPGEYRDYLSKELVEKTRLFYGRCYENQPALLWLSEYRETGGWVKSEYLVVFDEDGLESRYNENRQPSIPYTENKHCVELPGIRAETEP